MNSNDGDPGDGVEHSTQGQAEELSAAPMILQEPDDGTIATADEGTATSATAIAPITMDDPDEEVDTTANAEPMVIWNEKDGIYVKESDFGGVLTTPAPTTDSGWEELSKKKGRFYIPNSAKSSMWDFMAYDTKHRGVVCLIPGNCDMHYSRSSVNLINPNSLASTMLDHVLGHQRHLKSVRGLYHDRTTLRTRPTERTFSCKEKPKALKLGTDAAFATLFDENSEGAPQQPITKKGTLDQYRGFIKLSKDAALKLSRGVAAFTVRGNLPCSVVEHQAFIDLMDLATTGGFKSHSRHTNRRHHQHMYDILIGDMKALFCANGADTVYSFACDIWSSRAHDSFMGHIVTYIGRDFKLYELTTGCAVMRGSHSGVAIKAIMDKDLHDKFGVPASQFWGCTRDGAANMGAGLLDAYDAGVICVNHTMQNSIKDALEGRAGFHPGGIPELNVLMKVSSNLTTFLRSSPKQLEILASFCDDTNTKFRKPQPSIDVRWHSQFNMLLVIYRLKDALEAGWGKPVSAGGLPIMSRKRNLRVADWNFVKQVLVVLSMILKAGRALEASSGITISKAMPELCTLYANLSLPIVCGKESCVEDLRELRWEEEEVLPTVKLLKERLCESLRERFPLLGLEKSVFELSAADKKVITPFLVAMAMDPMVDSGLYFLIPASAMTDAGHANALRQDLMSFTERVVMEHATRYMRRTLERSGVEVGTVGGTVNLESDDENEEEDPWDRVAAAQVAASSGFGGPGASSSSTTEMCPLIKKEFMKLTQATGHKVLRQQHKNDVRHATAKWVHPCKRLESEWKIAGGWATGRGPELHFWFHNEVDYPHLSKFARMVLALPASSSGAERMFSGSGYTVSPYRSSLTPDNVSMMTMLRDNFYPGLMNVAGYTTKRKRGDEDEAEEKAEEKSAEETARCELPVHLVRAKTQVEPKTDNLEMLSTVSALLEALEANVEAMRASHDEYGTAAYADALMVLAAAGEIVSS